MCPYTVCMGKCFYTCTGIFLHTLSPKQSSIHIEAHHLRFPVHSFSTKCESTHISISNALWSTIFTTRLALFYSMPTSKGNLLSSAPSFIPSNVPLQNELRTTNLSVPGVLPSPPGKGAKFMSTITMKAPAHHHRHHLEVSSANPYCTEKPSAQPSRIPSSIPSSGTSSIPSTLPKILVAHLEQVQVFTFSTT